MRILWARWTIGISLAALCSVTPGCDRSSSSTVSDAPPNLRQDDPSSRPGPSPTNIALGNTMEKIQKLAEDGDVSSMITLARTLEGMDGAHRAEARKWYQKASEAGDRSAKEALQVMDAADLAARHPTEPVPSAPTAKAPAADTNPAPGKSAGTPVDLSKLRWQDILGSFDNHDFSTVTQPNFHKRGDENPMFVAVSTSNDKMLTVAASGADDGSIDAVSIVLRIRTRENLGQNDRVSQAHSICDAVTRGNVMPNDLLDWLAQYLQTGKKTVPVFRNGWSITVSGTDAEGIADPKKFLGEAVLIEMKK